MRCGADLTLADLRPEVVVFAKAMEARLREQDARRGGNSWQRLQGLSSEFSALAGAARTNAGLAASEGISKAADLALREAADCGNYVMMIADLAQHVENRDRLMAACAPAPRLPVAATPPKDRDYA